MNKLLVRLGLSLGLTLAASCLFAQETTYFVSAASLVDDDHIVEEGDAANEPLELTIDIPGYGLAVSYANIQTGVNHASARASALDASNPVERLVAASQTMWTDSVIISKEGLDGTVGTFTTSMFVHGDVSIDASPEWVTSPDVPFDVSWSAGIIVNSPTAGIQDKGWAGGFINDPNDPTKLVYAGDPLNAQQVDVTFEFVYGEAFNLSGLLNTNVQLDNPNFLPGTFNGTVDLSNTATWGGMKELRDENGNIVTDVSLFSASGVDWRQPVPEPTTMAVLGLGGLALLRRRRRS